MTREEAIKTLREDYCGNRIICELYPDQCNREDCEIWLAIKALAEQPIRVLETQPDGDTISRQAAIDEIEYELEMINSALDSITLDFNARERLRQRRGEAREILNSIQQLPSAQPDLCDGCDRYGASCVGEGCGKLEMPEIIRCRDCRKYRKFDCPMGITVFDAPDPDGYCYKAERRTDGTEQP